MSDPEITRTLSDTELSGILHAPDWEQLRHHAIGLLNSMEIDDFMFRISFTAGTGSTHRHVCGSLPPTLLDLFRENNLGNQDPVDQYLKYSNLPIGWQTTQWCASSYGPIYARLKANGVHHGLSVGVRCKDAESRVDFYGKLSGAFPLSTPQCADLNLLSAYLHAASRALWKKEAHDRRPILTERERECLQWSACGKTSREIALILGISHHTVYFHTKNAAAKLQVYGTRHAVSRATTIGLI